MAADRSRLDLIPAHVKAQSEHQVSAGSVSAVSTPANLPSGEWSVPPPACVRVMKLRTPGGFLVLAPLLLVLLFLLGVLLGAGGLAPLQMELGAQADAPVSRPTAVDAQRSQLASPANTRVPSSIVPKPIGQPSPASPTAPTWLLTANRGTIKGFTNKVSAGEGESLSLFVTTPAPSFDVLVYRLGWYDNGARSAELVDQVRSLPGIIQPPPELDQATGLVSAANWTSNGTVTVSGWRTGLYLLKLVAADGDQNYIPLVVRDDLGQHDVLFEHSANTDQAYNGWGGKSLYIFNSSGDTTVGGTTAAVKVSFDRPFEGTGSGRSILTWELNMVRWLEANGFDVGYVSDLDVHREPGFAARARAVVQVGHNEYWSKEMRDHLEAAHGQGKGLGFFTGDTGHWAVRFEDSPLGSQRVLVCYRSAARDPLTASDPARATTRWREPPLNRPMHQFIGIGTNAAVERSADWVVEGVESAPTFFAETGFQNGDVVPNLVGYEYDGLWTSGAGPEAPPGLQILGRARVLPVFAVDELRTFAASYRWEPQTRPQAGRLATLVGAIQAGPNWALLVCLVSSARSVYLHYETESESAHQYQVGSESYALFPLEKEFRAPGWRPLERDLAADYASAFGPPPDDLRVDALVLRGALALGPVSITAPDGSATSITFETDGPPETVGWRVAQGTGTLTIQPRGPSEQRVLVMRPAALPEERRLDEAHTVALRSASGGLIVAVGTIQWTWALDGYGHHVDRHGNQTPVDPRIQALTRNIVRELIGK